MEPEALAGPLPHVSGEWGMRDSAKSLNGPRRDLTVVPKGLPLSARAGDFHKGTGRLCRVHSSLPDLAAELRRRG